MTIVILYCAYIMLNLNNVMGNTESVCDYEKEWEKMKWLPSGTH
jgi:hypothetical protein